MPWTEKHLQWLVDTGKTIRLACGTKAPVFEFRHTKDEAILSAWAKHFRNHYCRDAEIDTLIHGTPYTRAEYLRTIKFPDHAAAPGPSIRSGDVAEILVADYVQFVLGYWVPRTRYCDKSVRNESTKGCDILGFKIVKPGEISRKDTLAIFEAKAQFASKQKTSRLQDAIDGSAKDQLRKAESLNAAKQRLLADRNANGVAVVERFQNPEDQPYTEAYGAVAIFSTTMFCRKTESLADTSLHPFKTKLAVLVIRGDDLMTLASDLYKRAANEA